MSELGLHTRKSDSKLTPSRLFTTTETSCIPLTNTVYSGDDRTGYKYPMVLHIMDHSSHRFIPQKRSIASAHIVTSFRSGQHMYVYTIPVVYANRQCIPRERTNPVPFLRRSCIFLAAIIVALLRAVAVQGEQAECRLQSCIYVFACPLFNMHPA